jgi:hypothetical protein
VLALTLWGGQKVKERQIKIYGFDRDSISDGVISNDDLESRIVTLPDCFFVQAYERYKEITLDDGAFIDDIIKVVLSKEKEEAKKEWMEGLTLGDVTYKAWFATVGGMKVENDNGKCETFFVKDSLKSFIEEFENIMSLGKFKEIEDNGQKVYVNKDILSRLSLGFTSAQPVGVMPNIIVLPQAKYHMVKDYKTVDKKEIIEIEEGNETKSIEYSLIDYHLDDNIDVFDGGGIATPEVFKQIKDALNLSYDAEFAIIRGYGIAIKGMITKFDIKAYLDEFYENDTDFCKKENDNYYLKDYWNKWRKVTTKTMLLNESMVKLAKYYKVAKNENWYTYLNRRDKVDTKYKDIVEQLFVSKVNKDPEDVSEYRRLNYQLLTALALSQKDYYNLIQEDVRTYKKILTPFEKEASSDEWKINIDYIRLFFKNIVSANTEEELEEEKKFISENVVTKCDELLRISENFIKLKYVKRQLAKLIEKRCRDLACGKVTVKARYQYIGICPISYMNYAMTRKQGDNGLKTGQFYSSDYENDAVRTIARNPLCAYSEVHNVKFIKNDLLNKYLSPCKEIIYFNQQSDILALMSSADTDGDACTVIDNEIIQDAVVIPSDGKYFWNPDDSKKIDMVYNAENKFEATYEASGNLIGKIALKSASVNCNSQLTEPYYDLNNNRFISWDDIEGKKREEKKAFAEDKVGKEEWISSWKVPQEHAQFMKQRFYDNETDIYTVLYNAMVSIDAPKTLYFPNPEDMQVINDKYPKKAYFLRYQKPKSEVINRQYSSQVGLLDMASGYIKAQLLDVIDEHSKEFGSNHDMLQQALINNNFDVNNYQKCEAEVYEMYNAYTPAKTKIHWSKKRKLDAIKRNREELANDGLWDETDEEDYENKKFSYWNEAYIKYKELDKEYLIKAKEVLMKYTLPTVAQAIGNLKNCSEDFVLNLFLPVLEEMNNNLASKRYVFHKVVDESKADITYLYEHYEKIEIPAVNNRKIVTNLQREEWMRNDIIDLNHSFRVKVIKDNAIELLENTLKKDDHMDCTVELFESAYYLVYEGERIFEIFKEKAQCGKYSLLNASSVRIDDMSNIAPSRKSLNLVTTKITVSIEQ